jgi:predicted amidohydrolase
MCNLPERYEMTPFESARQKALEFGCELSKSYCAAIVGNVYSLRAGDSAQLSSTSLAVIEDEIRRIGSHAKQHRKFGMECATK